MDNEKREQLEQEIRNLTSQLSSSISDVGDWKIAKYYEYILAGQEAPYDINEIHTARQGIRDKINEIQAELAADE